MLSDYCKKIMDMLNVSVSETKKLSPDLLDTEYYVLNYKILQLYVRLGIKLKKIQRVFKLMNNSVYSTRKENSRNSKDLRLVTNSEDYQK